jgi:hypothetical protein
MKDANGNTVQVERIHRYRIMRGAEYEIIDFIPARNVPGYTHRIAVNNRLTAHYLGDQFKPSASVAVELGDLIRMVEAAKTAQVH